VRLFSNFNYHDGDLGMIYSGTAISVQALGDGIAEFKFDLANESVNKFNRVTLEDLKNAIEAVKADSSV
jgi:3-hydroxyacyl-CoA dehydrogenase/enoyl-CoA hydratase/3-hydroxybutyryl-CoA epimerase/enoyl-CoA isomerase